MGLKLEDYSRNLRSHQVKTSILNGKSLMKKDWSSTCVKKKGLLKIAYVMVSKNYSRPDKDQLKVVWTHFSKHYQDLQQPMVPPKENQKSSMGLPRRSRKREVSLKDELCS